jgi:hypothetical protein
MVGLSSTSKRSRLDPLGALWLLFAAPQTLMLLMGLVALSLGLGAVVPQASPAVVTDRRVWPAALTGLFGQWNGLARSLGLFDLYDAPWFHVLLALAGLCLFVRIVESAEVAWCATVRRRWSAAAFTFWGSGAPRARLPSTLSPDETLARMRALMLQRRFLWTDLPALPQPNAVACCRQLALWVEPVLYGALLVALAAGTVMGIWGWHGADWQPAPGETQEVGHDTAYAVRLDSFEMQFSEDGRLRDYDGQMTWLKGRTAVGQQRVGVGHPAALRGITVHQVGYVPAVRLCAWDGEGSPLSLQTAEQESSVPGEIEIVFPSAEAQPLVLLPSRDSFLALTFEPLSDADKPVLHLALFRGGAAVQQPLGALTESGSVTAEDLRVNVDLSYRPILRLDFMPAMGVAVAGAALAVLALLVAWTVPPRMVWIAVGSGHGSATLVQLLVPAGVRGRRWLQRLADEIRGELVDGA